MALSHHRLLSAPSSSCFYRHGRHRFALPLPGPCCPSPIVLHGPSPHLLPSPRLRLRLRLRHFSYPPPRCCCCSTRAAHDDDHHPLTSHEPHSVPPTPARVPRPRSPLLKRNLDVVAFRNDTLHAQGSTVEPVVPQPRSSLLPRSPDAVSPSTLWPSRSPALPLPCEKDSLAGIAVRPLIVKRRSTVPEDWDGPGGTVVLIDKPQGWSSFAVCGKLRHMLGVKKVGHAGTLDPLATGLLVICVGKATKSVDSYQAMTKVYSGTMRTGETTPSLDAGTPICKELPWEHIQEQDVQSAVEKQFLGDIMQVPPMYSAIKVKGERLYTKARRGEEIGVPPRSVKVYDFQLRRSPQNRQEWDFFIVCSKGTYIRSLCADLALSLGSCAYLTALRREQIGSMTVEDAWPIDELENHYREVLKVPTTKFKKSS